MKTLSRRSFSSNRLGARCFIPGPEVDKLGRITRKSVRDTTYDTGKRVDTYIYYYGDTNRVSKTVTKNYGNGVEQTVIYKDYENLYDENNKACIRITMCNYMNISRIEYLDKQGKVFKRIAFNPDMGVSRVVTMDPYSSEYFYEPIYYMGKPEIPDPLGKFHKRSI